MITRNRILFIVGLWNVLLPFLGFPSFVRTILIIVSGLIAIILAFMYSRDSRTVSRARPAAVAHKAPSAQGASVVVPPAHAPADTEHHAPHSEGFVPPAEPQSRRVAQPVSVEDRFTDLKSILKHTKTF